MNTDEKIERRQATIELICGVIWIAFFGGFSIWLGLALSLTH